MHFLRNGFSLAAGLGNIGNAVFGLLIVLENIFVASFPTFPLIAKLILKRSVLSFPQWFASSGRTAVVFLTRFSEVMFSMEKAVWRMIVLCLSTKICFDFIHFSMMWFHLAVSENE